MKDNKYEITWKEDMSLTCPHCGNEYETVSYLNITETECECDVCGGKYYVELWVSGFEQRCVKA